MSLPLAQEFEDLWITNRPITVLERCISAASPRLGWREGPPFRSFTALRARSPATFDICDTRKCSKLSLFLRDLGKEKFYPQSIISYIFLYVYIYMYICMCIYIYNKNYNSMHIRHIIKRAGSPLYIYIYSRVYTEV